jgi:hypothetical protein
MKTGRKEVIEPIKRVFTYVLFSVRWNSKKRKLFKVGH